MKNQENGTRGSFILMDTRRRIEEAINNVIEKRRESSRIDIATLEKEKVCCSILAFRSKRVMSFRFHFVR